MARAEGVKGGVPGSGPASEERDSTEVVGDGLTFEAAMARARSARNCASSSSMRRTG